MTLASNRRIQPATSGWVRYFDHRLPGETPHPLDNFFTSSGFAGWTQVNGGSVTGTWTESNGVASVSTTGGTTGDMAAQMQALSSFGVGNYIESVTAGVAIDGDFPHFGVLLADGVTAGAGQQVFGGYSANPRQVQCYDWSGYDTRDATTQFVVLETEPMWGLFYVRLLYVAANTFRTSFSVDGVSWRALSDASITCTPTHAGIAVSPYGSAGVQGRFYYFRVGSV